MTKGIFDIKDAINRVADRLNISKHTVYLYIRQRKVDRWRGVMASENKAQQAAEKTQHIHVSCEWLRLWQPICARTCIFVRCRTG